MRHKLEGETIERYKAGEKEIRHLWNILAVNYVLARLDLLNAHLTSFVSKLLESSGFVR